MPFDMMNRQAMPQRPQGLGGFLGSNSGMLMNAGMALLANRQNPQTAPLSQVAQMAALGSAMDQKRNDRAGERQTKNMTAQWMVDQGYAANLAEGMALIEMGAHKEILANKYNPRSDAGSKYGLNPVWGTDADGNPVLGQLSSDGSFKQVDTGDFRLSTGVDKIDMGTSWGLIDKRSGAFVGTMPKDIEGEKAAEVRGKNLGEAQVGLGETLAKTEQAVTLIDDLIAHPGRGAGTGLSSQIDPRNYVAGTDAMNFRIMHEQLKGKAFLQAFETLKGGGQITEREGAAATAAIARLETAQSDEEYVRALRELQAILRLGMDRARAEAGAGQPQAPSSNGGVRQYNPATGRIE